MQWNYHLRSMILATTSKFKMAAILETSHLFVRRYTFFPRPMFSRVWNAMKLSFLFYDHSNYLKLLWELQIDVSIIYSFFQRRGPENFDPEKGGLWKFWEKKGGSLKNFEEPPPHHFFRAGGVHINCEHSLR